MSSVNISQRFCFRPAASVCMFKREDLFRCDGEVVFRSHFHFQHYIHCRYCEGGHSWFPPTIMCLHSGLSAGDDHCCCLRRCHRRGDNSQRGFCWDWRRSLNTVIRKDGSEGQPFAIFTSWTVNAVAGKSSRKFSAANASDLVSNSNGLTDKTCTFYVKTDDSLRRYLRGWCPSPCARNHSTVLFSTGKWSEARHFTTFDITLNVQSHESFVRKAKYIHQKDSKVRNLSRDSLAWSWWTQGACAYFPFPEIKFLTYGGVDVDVAWPWTQVFWLPVHYITSEPHSCCFFSFGEVIRKTRM